MNPYAEMARRHWEVHLPDQVKELNDPTTFFTEMGERAANQILRLQEQIAGPDEPGEPYLQKTGRLINARRRAEEIVLREEVLRDPEPDQEGWLQDQESSGLQGWIPTTVDPTHPYWEETLRMEADDQETDQLYQRMLSEQSNPKGTPRT